MKTNIDPVTLERIYQDWFAPHADYIGILEHSGNSQCGNRLLLGMYAGKSSLFNLTHEMAHLIEIDLPRCHLPDWGLKYGRYWEIAGRSGYEPSTTQAAWREIRTFGIQHHLNLHYGIRDDKDEDDPLYFMARLVSWVPNYEFIPGRKPDRRPIYDWDTRESLLAIVPFILAEYEKWSLHSIRIKWVHRMSVLKQRQRNGALRRYERWQDITKDIYVGGKSPSDINTDPAR